MLSLGFLVCFGQGMNPSGDLWTSGLALCGKDAGPREQRGKLTAQLALVVNKQGVVEAPGTWRSGLFSEAACKTAAAQP